MKAPKARKQKERENPKLEMTPMIDVVFQLLIFFIVTLKQEDILAELKIQRPAPETEQKEEQVQDLVEIMIYDHKRLGGFGIALNKRKISYKTLDKQLTQLAKFSKNVSIIIKCTGDSPHSNLVKVLDICSKAGLTSLSVFSM